MRPSNQIVSAGSPGATPADRLRQLVLHHLHPLAAQRLPDLLQKPERLGGSQHIGNELADQRRGVMAVALVLAAQNCRITPRLREDQGGVRQAVAEAFVLAGCEEWVVGHGRKQSGIDKFAKNRFSTAGSDTGVPRIKITA
jgi:hypothetical protein